MTDIDSFIDLTFGVNALVFQSAIELSPGSQGSIAGAISEILLMKYFQNNGYEAYRIKEKPSGGNNNKNEEARGDFYVRKLGSEVNEWFVVESKGLKTNSEFRGSKLDSPEKVERFLKPRVFPNPDARMKSFEKGKANYEKTRELWESENRPAKFPPFLWTKECPGPESFDLSGLWADAKELHEWLYSQPKEKFTEEAYRNRCGVIAVLETHQPSNRVAPVTKIKQAAPLVRDFHVMAVDLFFRTGLHQFVFMDSKKISHSPSSPEHLYQNYIIDILVPGLKDSPKVTFPWFNDFEELLVKTKPKPGPLDSSQLDNRVR